MNMVAFVTSTPLSALAAWMPIVFAKGVDGPPDSEEDDEEDEEVEHFFEGIIRDCKGC